ncbi:tRNA (adenosine(37)-N6)-threonylcarbamoyltransferase complex dimerization subunit type 1 TsaB [Paenibacillus sediminis]|uniref:tRNA threonylcarbamoyladenosine biosynthesis protein TsaB n=1 Tax=Paenibacillus sediminis TaxID=664909 RepID=A0ABS4H4D3_9BACL|nr:tRNA (adenosine(37)-N6)-threonylcarbamoyltransferase complex dimerization subunit type 1 TsaB [Paenibacillus sediminis]MBP1937400.1 tRNA threonylcarbamoyladenosine biosynthesis protein TsaB [Paenibacillus sediminis]
MNNVDIEPHQRFLALDTSTASFAAAVMEGNGLLKEMNIVAERNHSVHVIPVVQRLLQETGTTRDGLGGIAVGVGPGSYTGIRIAVSAAKTLAWTWNIPLVSVSSLHALAWGGLHQGLQQHSELSAHTHWIVPLMDARRGQVYTALFSAEGSHMPKRLAEDGIRLMVNWVEQLSDRLKSMPEDNWPAAVWVVGDIKLHTDAAEQLRSLLGNRLYILPYEMEGRFVGQIGAQKLLSGEREDVHTIEPNYTQLTEAEANLLKKKS